MSTPICFLDFESTGTSVTKDKIVQIAIVKVSENLEIIDECKNYYINPEIPIPAEATAVHGITDEMVKEKPTFKAYAKGFYEYLEGCSIGGYNSNRFDIPLLSEEFARCGIHWPLQQTNFVDAYTIAAEKEKRNLAWAYQFYCGMQIEDAHNAQADIMATLEVFKAQVKHYEDLSAMSIEQLNDFCGGKIRVDLAGTIVLNDDGIAVYNIGKDKGFSVKQHPGFAKWMLDKDFTTNTKNIIKKLLNIM